MRKTSKNEIGITLIALVITIIVLLILAGVSITMLTGENGILTKSTEARDKTKQTNAEEQVKLATQGSIDTIGRIDLNDLNNELKKIDNLTYNGNLISDRNKIESLPAIVNVDGYNVEIKEERGNEPIIPEGFYHVKDTTVENGFVISDVEEDDLDNSKQGNQFVWIPVNKETFDAKFKRQEDYDCGQISTDNLSLPKCGEADGTGENSKIKETATTKLEAKEMYKSVKANGGFYIGRFEAGNEKEKLVVKKNVNVYNDIKWSANGELQETNEIEGGAVELARNFDTASGHTNIKSTLCYGVQWDAAMNFIDPNYITNAEIGTPSCSDDSYVRNGTGKGNYIDSDESNNPGKTGAKTEYAIKNIYDMAGNVFEWTMESWTDDCRLARGGDYYEDGFNSPASKRYNESPDFSFSSFGFRIALYL